MTKMTKDDKAKILQALGALAATLGQDVSSTRQLLYLDHLKDLGVEAINVAVNRAINTCRFFPSVAELRELAGNGDGKVALEDRATLAWENLRSLRGSKAYHEEALADPITKKCFFALGGSNGFGTWDYETQETWKRKQFISLYQSYSRTSQAAQELTHSESSGILQQINLLEGAHDAHA